MVKEKGQGSTSFLVNVPLWKTLHVAIVSYRKSGATWDVLMAGPLLKMAAYVNLVMKETVVNLVKSMCS